MMFVARAAVVHPAIVKMKRGGQTPREMVVPGMQRILSPGAPFSVVAAKTMVLQPAKLAALAMASQPHRSKHYPRIRRAANKLSKPSLVKALVWLSRLPVRSSLPLLWAPCGMRSS